MEIQLDCPWCTDSVRVSRDEIDADMTCGGCGVRFGFAADPDVELAAAA